MREDIPLAVPQLTAACAPGPSRAGWIVEEPRWDVYYAVVFAACLAIVEAGPLHATGRIIATAGLIAMVPWYIFLGRPLMNLDDAIWHAGGAGREAATRRGTVYLAGLAIMFAAAQSQDPNAWFLAFALCPQCFHVTTPRRGMVFVVIFNVIAGGLEAWRNPGLPGVLIALGIVIFAVTFSYVYSRWIIRVIEQSLDRAALIEQLESTRAELAAAHHEAGVLAERQRLAGEIHDTLAQGFTSIVTLLQAAKASLAPEKETQETQETQETVRRHLDLALATARENLAEARSLVTALPRRRWRQAPSATPCRGHREDAPAARVRQAGRVRPHRGGDHRYRARPAAPSWPVPVTVPVPVPVTAASTRAVSVRSGRTTCAPAAASSAAE